MWGGTRGPSGGAVGGVAAGLPPGCAPRPLPPRRPRPGPPLLSAPSSRQCGPERRRLGAGLSSLQDADRRGAPAAAPGDVPAAAQAPSPVSASLPSPRPWPGPVAPASVPSGTPCSSWRVGELPESGQAASPIPVLGEALVFTARPGPRPSSATSRQARPGSPYSGPDLTLIIRGHLGGWEAPGRL